MYNLITILRDMIYFSNMRKSYNYEKQALVIYKAITMKNKYIFVRFKVTTMRNKYILVKCKVTNT